jgi:antitoxin CcdA
MDAPARKRPVNLTLNESVVAEAKSMTDNLSGVVESLLTDFVIKERKVRLSKSKVADAAAMQWNKFNEKSGSIADEYSTL